LRESFSRLAVDGGRLAYRFTLHDGPLERSILEQVRSRKIHPCSIAFVPQAQCRRDVTTVYSRAAPREISLCDGRKPQWYGTSVIAEAV
jgi:hypothetical protein